MEEVIKSLTDAVHTTQGICTHDKGTLSYALDGREYFTCDKCGQEEEL